MTSLRLGRGQHVRRRSFTGLSRGARIRFALPGQSPLCFVHWQRSRDTGEPGTHCGSRERPGAAIDMMISWGFGEAGHLHQGPIPGNSMAAGGWKTMHRNAPDGLASDLKACDTYKNGEAGSREDRLSASGHSCGPGSHDATKGRDEARRASGQSGISFDRKERAYDSA